jgi:hypothetical protein
MPIERLQNGLGVALSGITVQAELLQALANMFMDHTLKVMKSMKTKAILENLELNLKSLIKKHSMNKIC